MADKATEMQQENKESKKGKALGCGLMLLVVGGGFLSWGIWLLNGWQQMSGGGRATAVALVVAGSLILLPVLLVLVISVALRLAIHWFLRGVGKNLEKALGNIAEQNKAMYADTHDYRPAVAEDFEGMDLEFYERTQTKLEGQGFVFLGDMVNATVEENTGVSTVIRIMKNGLGDVSAGFYHWEHPDPTNREATLEMHVCDVTTEFSDGQFLVTSNTHGVNLATSPPEIQVQLYPLATELEVLLREHERRKASYLAEHEGTMARMVQTLEEVMESEGRQQALKSQFRRKIGFVDPQEVQRVAEEMTDLDEVTKQMAVEAARKRQEEERE